MSNQTMLTHEDLTTLKSKINQQAVIRNHARVEQDEYVDEFGNTKVRNILIVQNKGNTYPVKTLLSYANIVSATKEQSEVIAEFFVNKFNTLESADKLHSEDLEPLAPLVSRGILTKTELKGYSNAQITNLIKSYYSDEIVAKVIKALPLLLKEENKAKEE